MRFRVVHATDYSYDVPVTLGPHIVRLRPRADGTVRLVGYALKVAPEPVMRSEGLDLNSNAVTHLWFSGTTTRLSVESAFEVETLRTNPFDFLPVAEIARLPAEGPAELAPCRAPRGSLADAVVALSDGLANACRHDTLGFLSALNTHLFERIAHDLRHDGEAHPPEQTLAAGIGACRDITMLFLAACRAQGLAGRFVSGYQARSKRPERHLHAWPEIYLPGGGWRGFDPTRGLAIADTHVAVAAAPTPAGAMPIEGSFSGSARSRLTYDISIEAV
ncbi:MAG: transglutaminase family protein [Xanthobacteraceae bacterium]